MAHSIRPIDHFWSRLRLSAFVGLLLCATGCSTAYKTLRADPPVDTPFLPAPEKMHTMPSDYPFEKIWLNPAADLTHYHSIIVAPVTLQYLDQATNTYDVMYKFDKAVLINVSNECARLAKDLQTCFTKAIATDPKHRFHVAGKPAPNTLRLEMAIIQFFPSKALANIIANTLGFICWPVGLAAMTPETAGHVAIEGRITDAQTGKLMVMFADREMDQTSILNIPSMTWRGTAELTFKRWSRDFVRIANATNKLDIRAPLPFEPIVW